MELKSEMFAGCFHFVFASVHLLDYICFEGDVLLTFKMASMKLCIQICFVGIFILFDLFTAKSQSLDLSDFKWILGKWERTDTKSAIHSFEEWKQISEALYIGKGWTMEGGDTVFVENLRIIANQNKYYYEAVVAHNSGPVRFEITTWDDSSFESINPKHDFPTNINYQFDGIENLKAIISNPQREIRFEFRKLQK
jgi:hypothetical protein